MTATASSPSAEPNAVAAKKKPPAPPYAGKPSAAKSSTRRRRQPTPPPVDLAAVRVLLMEWWQSLQHELHLAVDQLQNPRSAVAQSLTTDERDEALLALDTTISTLYNAEPRGMMDPRHVTFEDVLKVVGAKG